MPLDISELKSVEVKLHGQGEVKIAIYVRLSDQLSSNEYEINDAEELSQALAMMRKNWLFTDLEQFQAKNCDERLNEFLSILLKRSERLEHLTIKECSSLKHVFDLNNGLVTEPDGEGKRKYLTRLKIITIRDLPKLTCIWNKDPTQLFDLGCLEKIEIMKCGYLKILISASVAENLGQLQVLKLHSCQMVEEVVSKENHGLETQKRVIIEFPLLRELELMDLSKLIKFHIGNCALEFPSLRNLRIDSSPKMIAFTTGFASAEEPSTTDKRSFTELNELKLDKCGKLIYVISSNILPRFQKLTKLTVNNCDSLKEVIQFHRKFHSVNLMLSQLSELVLTHLPNLMHVINTKFASARFFENLQILQVKDCNSLKYLFFPSATGSVKLKEIEISDCTTLEEIFVTKGEDMTGKILLSDLKSIGFPSLEILEVANCPALKTFVSGFHAMTDLPTSSNNYFFNSESLEKLKELRIRNQDGVERLWHNNLPLKSFYELEVLILSDCNNLLNIIPFSMLIRYKKLRNITVERCKLLEEVFDLEKDIPDDNATEMLPQIRELILNYLPSLACIWNKEPQVPVFQNLESLQIVDCGRLKKVFSLSVASYRQKLKLLKLYGCEKMEEVFDENGSKQKSMIFPNVEFLILKELPSLESFCRNSCTFEWPSLHTVRVSKIPKMKTFSKGDQITPV